MPCKIATAINTLIANADKTFCLNYFEDWLIKNHFTGND